MKDADALDTHSVFGCLEHENDTKMECIEAKRVQIHDCSDDGGEANWLKTLNNLIYISNMMAEY